MTSEFESYSPELEIGLVENDKIILTKESISNSILDVPITLSAILGRTKLSISEVINLSEGSILDLEKAIGEPVELFIKDQQIARGELILVDEQLSITITEILDNQ